MNEARYREVERRVWASLGLEPVERSLRLGRLGTTVRVQELGTGPAVLFVHGGSASGANWAPMLPSLDGFRCVLLDRPGCGLSEPHGIDLSDIDRFATFADDLLVDVLDTLQLPTAKVVATSLGGYLAIRGAAAHPSRFERIVEFAYVPGAPITHVPWSMRLFLVPGMRRAMTAIPPTRGAVTMILRQLGLGPAIREGRITDETIEWFLSLLRDTDTMRNDTNGPRALLSTRHSERLLPAAVLSAVTCPIRFVWSADDPIGGAAVATGFVPQFARGELELWDHGGHAPWMDQPQRAAKSVAAFLA